MLALIRRYFVACFTNLSCLHSRFNALFVRPHIRGAIREYQTQLIQRVIVYVQTLNLSSSCTVSCSSAFKFNGLATSDTNQIFHHETVIKPKVEPSCVSFSPSLA